MSTSSQDLERRAGLHATAQGTRLEHRLGFGRDGTVYSTAAGTAVKSYVGDDPFERELACYRRLGDVDQLSGHRIPRLLTWDAELLAIEMTIVEPPYLLDFAGAYLDRAPDFSPEVIEQWREEKLDQFGSRWADVEALLELLRPGSASTCWT